MLTLSLLLSAAAGVNAILGGDVEAIKIPGESFICADGCAFNRVFFSQTGYFCPEDEIVVRVDKQGNLDDEWATPFQCTGEEVLDGISTRQPSKGEKRWDCIVSKITDPNLILCNSNKEDGDASNKRIVEWSDIEKELKQATENKATPEEVKPATDSKATPEEAQPKTEKKHTQDEINKCGKPAQEFFVKCRKTDTFKACEEKGREVMESCLRAL